MKPKIIVPYALLVVALGYAGYLQMRVSYLSETLAAAQSSALSPSTPKPVATLAKTPEPVPPVQQPAPTPQPEATVAASPGNDRREEWRERRQERMARMAAAFDDPEMRLDMIERQMGQIDERYAKFFKQLNVSPEELDTLKALMAERGIVGWETRMRSMASGEDVDRDTIREEQEAQRELIDRQIESLLGEDSAAALEDYTDSLPVRREVDQLVSSLSYTDSPLSEQQSEHLVDAIRAVDDAFEYTEDLSGVSERRGPGAFFGSTGQFSEEQVDRYFAERSQRDQMIIAAAAESLSEKQLNAFAERQIAERERERRQMSFMLQNRDSE